MIRFLDLPGEIRNRIYAYVYPQQEILLRTWHHNRLDKTSQQASETPRKGLKRETISTVGRPSSAKSEVDISNSLLLTCSKVCEEVKPLIYMNCAFTFDSTKAINSFLKRTCSQSIRRVRALTLLHGAYGEPQTQDMRRWKIKHDRKWMATCRRIGEEMRVEYLRIDVQICDWPTQLNLKASWAKPLLALKGEGEGFCGVNVVLRHSSFSEIRLSAAAKIVEKALMNGEGLAARQREDDLEAIRLSTNAEAKATASPTAIKVLNITFNGKL